METKVNDFLARAKENLDQINRMNDAIKKAGGLFYQYRPCRIDKNTIYFHINEERIYVSF